jgi:peptidyl-prolyl cis-trans isomerase SurA
MMFFKVFFFLFLAEGFLINRFIPSAFADSEPKRVLAVVNDEIVTSYDVDSRIKMLFVNSPEEKASAEMKKEVLFSLIDEKLKTQEGKKQGIVNTQEEIDDAILRVEMQNGMKKGDLRKILNSQKIPFETLRNQINADLIWMKILVKEQDESTEVTDEEINARQKYLKEELQTTGFLIGEISFPYAADKDKKKAKRQAQSAFARLQNGELFQKVAESFASSGELKWVQEDDLDQTILSVLKNMSSGQISKPVDVKDKYVLLALVQKREATSDGKVVAWEVVQIGVSKERSGEVLDAIYRIKSCDMLMEKAKKLGLESTSRRQTVPVDQLPPVLKLPLDQEGRSDIVVGPVEGAGFNLFLMKCGKDKKISALPTKEQTSAALKENKMKLFSKKKLQDIKRSAVIDIK